ncbi:MAG: sugar phosphate isomerase/epimerase family protein [Oscillospiraceae bacterium]
MLRALDRGDASVCRLPWIRFARAGAELSQRYGVRIVGFVPNRTTPSHGISRRAGNEARARTLAYFKNVVDIAAELGAEQVMVSSGWAFLNEPIEDAWGRSASMLRAISEHAGELGVRLVLEALQSVESTIVNSAADTKRNDRGGRSSGT